MRRFLSLMLVAAFVLTGACHKKDAIPGAPGGKADKKDKKGKGAEKAPGELPGDVSIKNPEVAYNMALEFAGQRNMEAAHHYIDLAQTLQPDSKYLFSKGLFFIVEKKYTDALTNLKASMELGPGTEENRLAVLNATGVCYMELGQDEEALKCFRDVVNKPGLYSRYESYYNMGVVYLRQGKRIDAEAVFQKVVEENPVYYRAYNKLGVLSAQKGEWANAALSYKKAIDLISNNYGAIQSDGAEIYYNYGEALAQQRMYGKARDALLQVLKIAPESEYGQRAKSILAQIGGGG
jgi:tetratricopeptide (TPR) repeat protein